MGGRTSPPKANFQQFVVGLLCRSNNHPFGVQTLGNEKGEVSDLKVSGLFFDIGHEPATKFLDKQVELDSEGYVVMKPGTTLTNVRGVFAAGDVQDKKHRQAITAAGSA
ncbi:hypothetical protein RND71_033884 [Anisodus tanguticus]|uniref:FAD/NAD(P)-binding domain-containing protein n=1 Tax=Anisodus tanguticus TaxID=243964 RepID=A0AAE1V4E5_9SOLA|nr:hypothetical protein RND71_033884 [Anisodus tanguticus]